jgi:hypothetical protein
MAPRKKYTPSDKFIIRLARSHKYWPCKACSDENNLIWHEANKDRCPYTGKLRSECEDQSKELK